VIHPADNVENTARYEQCALALDEAQGNASRSNPISDEFRALAELMRVSGEGRRGLESLLTHPNRGVRVWAATECLVWTPEKAIPVLEALRDTPGSYRVDAEYSLIESRQGNFFDGWTPS